MSPVQHRAFWGSLGAHALALFALAHAPAPALTPTLGVHVPVEIAYAAAPSEDGEGSRPAARAQATPSDDLGHDPAWHSAKATRAKPRVPGHAARAARHPLTTTHVAPPAEARAATPDVDHAGATAPREAPTAQPKGRPAVVSATPGEGVSGNADLGPGATTRIDLSPAATAAAWLAHEPQSCTPPEAVHCELQRDALPDAGPSPAQMRLQSHLDEMAAAVPHLSERPPPELHRDLDGNYHFESGAIRAVIHHDGSFEFEDKIGGVSPIPIAGSFDITFFVEKHILGKTIFAEEKAWFLKKTAALRTELADAARQANLKRGQRALRGRLIAILEDPNRSAADKRAAVFSTWDTCAQDEIGRRGQEAIEALIREWMPQGSPLAYGEAELAALNAQRASPRPFAPY